MSEQNPTLIGRVTSVLGATITVALEPDLAGVSPIWNGQLHNVGQIGTTVALPQGTSKLLGSVTRLSLTQLTTSDNSVSELGPPDLRSIEVQLTGEIDALGVFHRGVANHPGIDDPVHFVSGEDLISIYPKPDATNLAIGALSANRSIPVSVNLGKLVMRHSVVVGSTGAGKSSIVAALLQGIERGPWPSANVVVIDSHGEYKASAGTETARIDFASATHPVLPAWMLPAVDILAVYTQGPPSVTVREKFASLVADARRAFARDADWITIPEEEINSDTPIPFDLREVWFELDTANRRTHSDTAKTQDALVSDGDAQTLTSSVFEPYKAGSVLPNKGAEHGNFGTIPDQIRRSLTEPRLAFLGIGDLVEAKANDPLPSIVTSLLGDQKRISLLDISGIPSDVANFAVGIVLNVLFELSWRGREDGIGRNNPVLIVVEEAHRYFNDTSSSHLAKTYVDRISREGRKYGIGVMLVTQRPSELPKTALSQVGTIVALRLNNDSDQATIAAALPDGIAGIAQMLPALRTGEAIITGEALPIPSRVVLRTPNPWPSGTDPGIDAWTKEPKSVDVTESIQRWRLNK